MNAIWQWIKNKAGRIVTVAGALLSGVEGFDITPIKDPIESLIGHTWVLRITVGLFLLSWARHQYVATTVAPKPDILPPPVATK
jgi:hypothetical protein